MQTTMLLNAALGLLARREHGSEELKRKLIQKYHPSTTDLQEVFSRLNDYNYLDDERFSVLYCRSRISKGFGPDRIIRDLTEKGIAGDLASNTVEKVDNWVIHAQTAKEKKFKSPPLDLKDKQKQMQFLRYRGFRFDQINECF